MKYFLFKYGVNLQFIHDDGRRDSINNVKKSLVIEVYFPRTIN